MDEDRVGSASPRAGDASPSRDRDSASPPRRRRSRDDEAEDSDEEGEDLMKDNGNLVGSGVEDSSEEEEEDDPEEARRVAEGFIVDEEEDDEKSDDDDEERRRKRRRRKAKRRRQMEEAEELDEEDLELIRGDRPRKSRFRRGSGGSPAPASKPKQTQDLARLFDGDDEEAQPPRRGNYDDAEDEDDDLPAANRAIGAALDRRARQERAPATGFEDEMDDFIDDDDDDDDEMADMSEGEKEQRREEKREQRRAEKAARRAGKGGVGGLDAARAGIDQEAWEELNEIFGQGEEYMWAYKKGDLEGDEGEGIEDEEDEEQDEDGLPVVKKKAMEYKDIFEPAAIKARMLTEEDERIKRADFPERFQTALPGNEGLALLGRQLDSEELDEATRWTSPRISQRCTRSFLVDGAPHAAHRAEWMKSLRLMVELVLNEHKEAMYLAVHKIDACQLRVAQPDGREVIVAFFTRRDLHGLVAAALRFKALLARKSTLRATFERLEGLSDQQGIDFERMISRAESAEEITDISEWLTIRFGQRIHDMNAIDNGDAGAAPSTTTTGGFKRPTVVSQYERIRKTPIAQFAAKYGIPSTELAENVCGQSRRYFTEDEPLPPRVVAQQFVNTDAGLASADVVLASAKLLLSHDIGKDPMLKQEARNLFRDAGLVDVKPTDRGQLKIDDEDPFFNFKYLRSKPVQEFRQQRDDDPVPGPAQWLMILQAEEQLLVNVKISAHPEALARLENRLYESYASEGVSEVSRLWNEARRDIIKQAIDELLEPAGRSWVKEWLREECRDLVGRACEESLAKRAGSRPMEPSALRARRASREMRQGYDDEDEDEDEAEEKASLVTPKVLAVSHGQGDPRKDTVVAVFLDARGRLIHHEAFDSLAPQPSSSDAAPSQTPPRQAFVELLKSRRPDVIVVNGFSARTAQLRQQLVDLAGTTVQEIMAEQNVTGGVRAEQCQIEVSYVTDDVARLYQHSSRAAEEFPTMSTLARYCIALARYAQSPVQEFAALDEEELVGIRHDPHQHLLPKERLQDYLERAMCASVNQVCVDVNRAVADSLYYGHMLKYVAGLGPRKAHALVRAVHTHLKGTAVNRSALLIGAQGSQMIERDIEILAPSVWHNAAGFLTISGTRQSSFQGAPDVLDSTRIHPENYEYARFIAFDALRKTEEDREDMTDPSGFCHELFRDPQRDAKVQSIDMADYEQNLMRIEAREGRAPQRKLALLEGIARELASPLRDARKPHAVPTPEEMVVSLTGESIATFRDKHVVNVTVRTISPEHVVVFLESGVEGHINAAYLRDHDEEWYLSQGMQLPRPRDLVKPGKTLKAQIIDLDPENIRVELTARADHLLAAAQAGRSRTPVDPRYFDLSQDAAARSKAEAEKQRRKNIRNARFIQHPNFHNFKAGQAEEYLANPALEVGTAVVRPSSKGPDHLAITWKVDEGVYQHIDVLELEKDNEHSLGKVLRVGNMGSYSDLDELLVNHIQPMAKMVRDMFYHDKFKGRSDEELNKFLTNYSMANPNRSIYAFGLDRQRPGYFKLSFKTNRDAPIQTWPVKVLPGRYKLHSAELPDLASLCNAFKTQITTMISASRGGRTPGALGGATPFGAGGRTPALSGGMTPGGSGRYTPRVGVTPNPYGAAAPPPGPPPRPGPPPQMPGPPPAMPSMAAFQPGPPPQRPPGPHVHPSRW